MPGLFRVKDAAGTQSLVYAVRTTPDDVDSAEFLIWKTTEEAFVWADASDYTPT